MWSSSGLGRLIPKRKFVAGVRGKVFKYYRLYIAKANKNILAQYYSWIYKSTVDDLDLVSIANEFVCGSEHRHTGSGCSGTSNCLELSA